jgi:hypothetical protein
MLPSDPMPLALAAAGAAACLVLALVAVRMRLRRRKPLGSRGKAPAAAAPRREGQALLSRYHPSAVRVLTGSEHQAFDLAREALPRHVVMPQVPLVRYLRVQDKRTEDDWLRGLSMLSADILVCDSTSRPVLAIEILPTKPGSRAQERHERIRQLLEGVGIRVLVWQDGRLPAAQDARMQLQAALQAGPIPVARPAPASDDAKPARSPRAAEAAPRAASARVEPELGMVGAANGAAPSAAGAGPAGAAATARTASASAFAPLIPVPEIAELLAEGDEIAARHSRLDPVSLTFFDEFEARPQGSPSPGLH